MSSSPSSPPPSSYSVEDILGPDNPYDDDDNNHNDYDDGHHDFEHSMNNLPPPFPQSDDKGQYDDEDDNDEYDDDIPADLEEISLHDRRVKGSSSSMNKESQYHPSAPFEIQDHNDNDNADDTDSFPQSPGELSVLRSRTRLSWKNLFLSFFLLLVGVVFFFTGLGYFLTDGLKEPQTLPFLIIGGITLIPGSYASLVIVMVWCGKDGYYYDMIPHADQ